MKKIDYIKQTTTGQIAKSKIDSFIHDIVDENIKVDILKWYEHYQNILQEYNHYIKHNDGYLSYDYLIEDEATLKNEIHLYEITKDLNTNPRYHAEYNINEIIIGYLTNQDLKMHYYEFNKVPGNVENKALYLIEQKIDKRNPNVCTDKRQFDFNNILNKPPFTEKI